MQHQIKFYGFKHFHFRSPQTLTSISCLYSKENILYTNLEYQMWLGYPDAIVLEWRQKRQGIPQVCFKKKKKVKGREVCPGNFTHS